MFTHEQVRTYRSLELRYPEHEAPRKLSAPLSEDDPTTLADGLYFVIGDDEQIDCGGKCGQEHKSYYLIEPINGEPLGSLFGDGPIISNTFGESMMEPFTLDNAVEVVAEDWPNQSVEVESDPWLGLDF